MSLLHFSIELERDSCFIDIQIRPSLLMLEYWIRVETGNTTKHYKPLVYVEGKWVFAIFPVPFNGEWNFYLIFGLWYNPKPCALEPAKTVYVWAVDLLYWVLGCNNKESGVYVSKWLPRTSGLLHTMSQYLHPQDAQKG